MEEKETLDEEEMVKGDLLLAFFDSLKNLQDGKKTREDLKNDLINLSITNAYNDATLQGAYNALFTDNYFENKEIEIGLEEASKASNEAQRDATDILINGGFNKDGGNANFSGVNGLLSLNKVDNYGDWQRHLCEGVIYIYKNKYHLGKLFTYGNAQKWVNMTVKYLYIYSYLLDKMNEFTGENNPLGGILKYRNEFHIPLDGYIMKALFLKLEGDDSISKQINVKFKENNTFDLINYENHNYANKQGAVKIKDKNLIPNADWKKCRGCKSPMTWSNIETYDEYEIIQNEVKKQMPTDNSGKFELEPLVWENKVWTLASGIIKALGI